MTRCPTPLTRAELAQMRRYLESHPVGLRLIAEVLDLRDEVKRLRSIVLIDDRRRYDDGAVGYPRARA